MNRHAYFLLTAIVLAATACSSHSSSISTEPPHKVDNISSSLGIFATIRPIRPAPVAFPANWTVSRDKFAQGLAVVRSIRSTMVTRGRAETPTLARWRDFVQPGTTTPIIDSDRAVYVQTTAFSQPLHTRYGVYDNATLTVAIDAQTGKMLGDRIVGNLRRFSR